MAKTKETSIDVISVDHKTVRFCVLGKMPIILHRMSEKAAQELLMPKGKKTSAEKASSMKHDPYAEFRAAPYLDGDENGATYIQGLATWFKGALRSAALDLPGASKSQIGRLTWVEGERIPLYGIPQLFMAITRSSDINKTPDVRTRAIIKDWACTIDVTFVSPMLREQPVANLMAMAGMVQGVGDWRPGKGSSTYGQFTLVSQDDPQFQHIIKHGGRAAQIAAMESPECYNDETAELLGWFDTEAKRRGFKVVV